MLQQTKARQDVLVGTLMNARARQANPESAFITRRKKVLILLAVVSLLLAYRLARQMIVVPEKVCIRDSMMTLTEGINSKINNERSFGLKMIIVAQEIMDIQFVMFILVAILRLKTFEMHAFMVAFYGIRAIFINFMKFPFPQGHFWESPPVPSIVVPYGKSRDFFYSGHTGFMVFALLLWLKVKYLRMVILTMAGLCFVVLTLISTRVHYDCDIFAGCVVSIQIVYFVQKYLVWIDKLFSSPYWLGRAIYRRIQKIRKV